MSSKNEKEASNRSPLLRPGPVGGKRDSNRQRRVEELQQAALTLFLENGIEGVSIDDIAASAAAAKGSFYRYFQDKEALVSSLLSPVSEAVLHTMGRGAEELSRLGSQEGASQGLAEVYGVLGRSLAEVLLAQLGVVRLYLQECRGPAVGARRPICALAAELRRQALDLTKEAQRYGLLRTFDPRVSSLAVIGAVEQLLLAVLSGEDFEAPEQVGSLVSLILDGLKP